MADPNCGKCGGSGIAIVWTKDGLAKTIVCGC